MRANDWIRILGWPGHKVYRHEIDESGKRLKLWVRRKRAKKLQVRSGCGKSRGEIVSSYEREVRNLPCFEYLTTVVVELYRIRCPDCGVKSEKVPLLPSKVRERQADAPVVPRNYQVVYTSDPAGPALPFTVKQVNNKTARDETGTTFLLGA